MKIETILKKIKGSGNYQLIKYALFGHGIQKADNKGDLYYSIRRNKLKIKYYYHHPTNFSLSEWITTEYEL